MYRTPVAYKAPRLESLRPDAEPAAIEVQALELRAATVDEDIQRPVEGIAAHGVACKGLQAVIRLPHIHRCPVQMYADLTFGKEHQLRTSVSTIPQPKSSRTSHRAELDPSAPMSMNELPPLPHERTGCSSHDART